MESVAPKSLRSLPEDRLFSGLHEAVTSGEPAVQALFLAAVAKAAEAANNPQIVLALILGRPEMIDSAIDWSGFQVELAKVWAQVSEASRVFLEGVATGNQMLATGEAGSQEAMVGRAASWLEAYGAERVTLITDVTRTALRSTLVDAYQVAGTSSIDAQRQIRQVLLTDGVGSFAGINANQVPRFAEQIAQWSADPLVSEARLRQLIRNRNSVLVGQRARLIARTELYEAGNQGLLEAWEEVHASGRAVIQLGDFTDTVGLTIRGRQVFPEVPRPPLHPYCHCAMRLKSAGRTEDGVRIYRVEWVTRIVRVCPRCKAMDTQVAAMPLRAAA
jgi:hypothetical protein